MLFCAGRLLLALLATLLWSAAAAAMTFTLHTPCTGSANFCGTRILGQGPITPQDADALRAAVARFGGSTSGLSGITLHSPGGSLMGGILLGQAIRELRLDAYAPESFSVVKDGTFEEVELIRKVQCYSACVYAFLGGVRRDVWPGMNSFGVHQFSSAAPYAGAESDAQIASTVLRAYVRSMGAPDSLVDLASIVRSNDLKILTRAELVKYRIDNVQSPTERWTVRALANGTPVLETTKAIGASRALHVVLAVSGPNLMVMTTVVINRGMVEEARLRQFPASMPITVFTVGRTNWKATPLSAWRRTDANGNPIFTAASLFDSRIIGALQGATSLAVSDDNFGKWSSDMAFDGEEVGVDGLAEGLRLLVRAR